ncbi:MAG: LysR family transcriptional regulator [Chelatococcus sp.]|uniref:LysR substrate-binding domain-containing protein n=1 Tax=unclassified Chelatococcus TaxID=2638111 RepID=UPI001BCF20A2|nr:MULTISPECIES: LysR substrate-binding domain-containing protein [unclassified Chelatococcus]CAH1651626.1 LysR family transcriptional regulator [Hyphomicrobiales bacterium]MBS7739883.1 LysR family transcriptional regulator [Chelatococcus sp. HY11]MBX3536579.1 LysR family transcriptional regulator [Chelatococcus sp.]MBX3545527.1 LysR family transcriptional regulator [Chelatococcus sp.]MCO5078818.1 LysR substrate-binding domain-containing protein [Chelatococcus sp.]
MRDLNDLYYFAAVVDHGGFSQAGRALGIQKSRLSRRVLLLEERLGVRLLNRSSRRFSVTEIGREFHERCIAMLVEAEAAEQIAAEVQAEPRGIVRMSCPTALLSFQFGELVARFMMRNPGIQVHLESTNRRVDVIAEGFDLAIRVRFPPLEPTDLVMRRLDESTQCLVAAPALIIGAPQSPGDLHNLPSLDLGPPHRDHAWQLHHADGQVATVPHSPRLVTDDMSVLRDAAIAGAGAVQLPTIFIWDDIRAGSLIHVLPDWRPRAGIVHAVFPSRRGLLPSVRALVDFLARECAIQRAQADKIVPPIDDPRPD